MSIALHPRRLYTCSTLVLRFYQRLRVEADDVGLDPRRRARQTADRRKLVGMMHIGPAAGRHIEHALAVAIVGVDRAIRRRRHPGDDALDRHILAERIAQALIVVVDRDIGPGPKLGKLVLAHTVFIQLEADQVANGAEALRLLTVHHDANRIVVLLERGDLLALDGPGGEWLQRLIHDVLAGWLAG